MRSLRFTAMCTIFSLLLAGSATMAQTGTTDARVYLTDGTIIMGQLIQRSDDLVIVRSSSGEIHTFEPNQIDRIVTLDSLGSQAQTVTVREFPYISFLGGTVAFGLISWLQFDTASDRDAEAKINARNGVEGRAAELKDKADRARVWGWSSRALALASLGVALIPQERTKRVFPEISVQHDGTARLQVVYAF
ncbi:MAG: hypothetical protein CME13_03165 [Gemmatimonadetes bacterium]|nr:hypothetical protein [Gemmatimonadota bacterium]MDP7362965.1 hypothetical protein [Candidatus Latescibacterota bacterium]MBU06961.1 hypothetical protein [Gemmatimonadota bacterium]MDP7634469.1 hypothetical protein [Candidatus Latescibacterota bacterium]MED5413724.1 hypothetical protein [Candidatus Latescibacterota bacterium]